jgi:predicted amidophosphoribosyltransferase
MLRTSKNQLPLVQLGLKRRVKDQRGLDAEARRENLSGAYRAPDMAGKKVLLFDDVLTTSATMQEMQRAVLEAGGLVTGFCVLARRFADSAAGEKI